MFSVFCTDYFWMISIDYLLFSHLVGYVDLQFLKFVMIRLSNEKLLLLSLCFVK